MARHRAIIGHEMSEQRREHKYVLYCLSDVAVAAGGSANGGRDEKMFDC
jgi:hypothetical protein